MRVTIDRNVCGAWRPACEECFGVFLKHGMPDRACVTSVVDDGSNDLNLRIKSGEYIAALTVTDENREAIISEGWIKFVDLPAEAFDIQLPHGDYVRRGVWRG